MKTKDKSFLILAFAVITLLEIFPAVRGCSPDGGSSPDARTTTRSVVRSTTMDTTMDIGSTMDSGRRGVFCPEHTCNDNKKCYTHAQQCDDHKDCDDNTDEDVGHCGNKICLSGSEAYYSKYST